MTDTSRLDALEIRIMHQDAAIDDLNKVITSQWKEIDRLTREILKLEDRLSTAEMTMDSNPADELPPPHW